ncbi:hypothetical protein [Brucella intermedia]|uniref:hypothetical protein n=1 Tax=Brucella intermedia TaxID=94625 RepID=UPI00124C692C|nr:hypothetical protein [Brucella intermedia]KAB2716626.1 hypothetical protein F9K75_11050 [Brucella intermedia]
MVVGEHAVKAAQKAYRECEGDSTESHRAALTAALPHLPRVGVKKLEWQQDGAGNHRAETPFGNEFIQKWTDTRDGNISYEHEGAYFETVEAAKAATQADYEARILSALEPSTSHKLALEEGFRKGLEAACEVIDKHSEYDRRLCCDGSECGCYGATVHQSMQHYIRALGTSREQLNKAVSNVPDQQENEPGAHGERERALEEAATLLEREADELDGLVDSVSHHLRSKAKTIRALSSPDHADAGKVEGDGAKWPIREVVAKAIAYHAVGDPHARTIRGEQRWEWFADEADKFISVFGFYLPSAPSQEVA